MSTRILIVEDEAPVRAGLVDLLTAKGYEVLAAETGPEGLAKARAAQPDLVLLDVMLPGASGYDVLRTLRAEGHTLPVIMVTAKGAELDKVLGFELGVDDYVTKPFSILELMGRIQAVLRRAAPATPRALAAMTLGVVTVDFQRLELRRAGKRVDVPTRAIEVLAALLRADGRIVSRDALLDAVWGRDQVVNPRTVDNLVVKLRQAIEVDPDRPHHLLTVHGRGYRFVGLDQLGEP
ncbi:MAG: DNA-binding response regulator [Cyanobacteria bacterium RYN_339]|nr:DNA-binding response regulator [Cyanobacteria bacterium RYN_339]